MNAILYVAGRADRLGEYGRDQPKVLLEFGGQSLLERHIINLAHWRVPKVFVVTGYLHEQLQSVFPVLQARYGLPIIELFNPHFDEGSTVSMYASMPALESAPEGVLIMDGDVLYDFRILGRLLESPVPTALLLDRNYSTSDDDPVLVPLRQGKPFEFLKCWKGEADAIGESIGFFKISPADLPRLVAETQARMTGEGRKESYDEILRALVKAGHFGAVDVTGLPWTEIDFPDDIEYANHTILPALQVPSSPATAIGPS